MLAEEVQCYPEKVQSIAPESKVKEKRKGRRRHILSRLINPRDTTPSGAIPTAFAMANACRITDPTARANGDRQCGTVIKEAGGI